MVALILGVTSGKGGTGKSTFSAALSLAFEYLGKKVLVIDLDAGLRCLDIYFGLDGDIVFDLSDALNKNSFEDCIYRVPSGDLVFLMPAPLEPTEIDKDKFALLLDKLNNQYDVIILDFPAGADFSLYGALGEDINYIAVCNPDPVSVRDARVVCDSLPKTFKAPRLVLNKFDAERVYKKVYPNIDDIIDRSGLRLLGIVPLSDELALLPINRRLKKKGKSMKAFMRIAGRLCNENIRLPKPEKI